MDRTYELLATAQRQLLAGVADGPERAVLAAIAPQVPSMIEERLPDVTAVILTPDTLRALLAQFALDLLQVQTAALPARARRRSPRAL